MAKAIGVRLKPARVKRGRLSGAPEGKRKATAASRPSARPSLVQALIDADGLVVVDRLVDRLGMTKQQIAEMIGVRGETLQKKARAEAPKTQERVREAIEIIDRVRDWAGGEAKATAWYKAEPIPAFGGRTAESIVKSGQATALRDYLDHLAMGGFA